MISEETSASPAVKGVTVYFDCAWLNDMQQQPSKARSSIFMGETGARMNIKLMRKGEESTGGYSVAGGI